MKFLAILILVPTLVLCGLPLPPESKNTDLATLQGSVRDYNGAVYVCDSCTVTVTGTGFQKTTALDDRGTFRVELPSGLYTITTQIPHTYPLKRAAFRLNPGETATLDLVPRLRVLAIETEVTEEGLKDTQQLAPPSRFEELDVDPKSQMKAIVEFERRDAAGERVVYRQAVLSYDTVTIYADNIAYDKASKGFEATGDRVTVDLGGTRKVTKQVKARLAQNVRCLEYDGATDSSRDAGPRSP